LKIDDVTSPLIRYRTAPRPAFQWCFLRWEGGGGE